MGQPQYSNERLLELARNNYRNLEGVCKTLDAEGYWEQPKAILKHSILEFLDLYVQAILVNMAVYCGRFHEDERSFIVSLPKKNMIQCTLTEEEENEEVLLTVKNMMKSPPILLQLCGVRDVEKQSNFTEQFFDSFLNILLTMTHINNARDNFANGFIQEYYEKIHVFINQGSAGVNLSPRYIFKKVSNDKVGEAYDFNEDKEKQEAMRSTAGKDAEPDIFAQIIEEVQENLYENLTEESFLEVSEDEEEDLTADENAGSNPAEEDINLPDYAEVIEKVEKLSDTVAQKQEEEIKEVLKEIKPKTKLEKYLEELDGLVGLEQVKEEINSLINLIKVRKLRESYKMPVMEMTYHMVFTGNPGTGKTTVARLVSKIYQELGILSKGIFVETDRSGLVAGYVGQTALKVKEIVEKALGGVLFIDEAYSLTNNVANDFGGEAIDMLVKMMEDHRDNLVVIVAGYKNEMKNFLDSNTGLVSRFNKFIGFDDYSVDELSDILRSMAIKAGVTISEAAIIHIKEKIADYNEEKLRLFGNARGIRNAFEKMMIKQANRLVDFEAPTKEQLCEVILEDVTGIL